MSRIPFSAALILALAVSLPADRDAAAEPDTVPATDPADPADPATHRPSDPMADFRLEEAILAMGAGDFERGLDLSLLVVMSNPKDARAHREAGRAAHALGRFQIAIDHLEAALRLQASQPDPEGRYLLGEAYYAAGRKNEAMRTHDQMRSELSPDTTNWMELLWLARVHARRKQLREADRIYLGLLKRDPSSEEVQIARIEAYTLSRKWKQAEKLLRQFIAGHPNHQRAPEMLAWILEAQEKGGEERKIRSTLAGDPTRAETRLLIDHARALERGGEYRAAISRYEEALNRVDEGGAEIPDELEVRAAVTRLRYRISPETAVAGGSFIDPSGAIHRTRAGVALPASDQVTLALVATGEYVGDGAAPGAMPTGGARVGSVDTSVIAGQGGMIAGSLTLITSYFSFDDRQSSARLGSAFDLRVGQGKPLQLHAMGNLNTPWREAASTLREGGRETGGTAMLYALPFGHRLIFDAGVQRRNMALDPMFEVPATGSQTMLIGGADWVVWAPSTQSVRGQFLDDDLRWGTSYLADSLTLSYRHYEAFTEDDFGGRLDLAERGTIDEVSTVARNTFPDGTFAFEGRAGGGFDWARATRMWRGGISLLVTPLDRMRGSVSYDYANEATSAFTGSRHTAWGALHFDF